MSGVILYAKTAAKDAVAWLHRLQPSEVTLHLIAGAAIEDAA